ncbi:MAG: DMT family transporter [Candidatus Accumulibacter sp.]|uniref:DMT family transporter n=1 Tax=Candidatus Accumulibacter proximus TaxID=2954385 RepID=A0A935UIB5_9PROT|nr:DMT family transporter [Candidatus Accumulibacter proximus]
MNRSQANLLLLAVAVIWGSAFIAQAEGMAGVGPLTFTGIRFLLGTAIVLPLAWREWQLLAARGARPVPADALGISALGLLLMLGAALQQIGIASTTVTNAGFLTALYVPLVPLLAWLILRTRPHWSVWPTSLGCLGGTWLLSGAEALDPLVGDAWVIASSVFWALHLLFVGRIADRIAAPFLVACGQFLVCGLISLLCAGLSEVITLAGIRQALLPIVYAGVVSVAIGFTAQVVGQRYAQPADAAIILSAETVFAALFGFLLMGDRLDASGLAGCALILVCIVVVQVAPMTLAAHQARANGRARGG